MVKNFWQKLNKPFYCLAPMADVTDAAFRRIIAKYGKPDVMWTEFVSCDGLMSVGREKLLLDLKYSDKEHPIVAQFFGSNPNNFYECSKLAASLGFDGIDINMGCPDRSINRQKAGADLINNPALAKEIVLAAKSGAPNLPVSIKTRIGYNRENIEEWLENLLKIGLAAITIHGRTKKEMSKVPAHWDVIARAVKIAKGSGTLIIGNGDVRNLFEAKKRVDDTGVDGVMIGRGIFGNPWLFSEHNRKCVEGVCSCRHSFGEFCDLRSTLSLEERFKVMVEHALLYDKLIRPYKGFDIMKKHFKAYVEGFEGAKDLRIKLMLANSVKEVKLILSKEIFT